MLDFSVLISNLQDMILKYYHTLAMCSLGLDAKKGDNKMIAE